jgi:hypothetical protein
VRPGNFRIGSPESRAIARLIAKKKRIERERAWPAREERVVAFPILGPASSEPITPRRSTWFESKGSKKLCCILWVPLHMSVEEAARIAFPEGI